VIDFFDDLLAVIFGAILLFVVAAVTFFLGWIPILAWVFTSGVELSWSKGPWSQWALLAVIEYSIIAAFIITRKLMSHGEDDIPLGVKLVSIFYDHPSKSFQNPLKDVRGFVKSVAEMPGDLYQKKIYAQKLERDSKEKEAEAELLQAQTRRMDAEESLQRAKAAEEALRKRNT